MNYLAIEKQLKRFLKTKIKITTGTVVAFLITGIISHAEELVINDNSANKQGIATINKIEDNQNRIKISSDTGKLNKVVIEKMKTPIKRESSATKEDNHYDIVNTTNVNLENNADLTLVSSELTGGESDESILHGMFTDGKEYSIVNNGNLIGENNANNSRINDGILIDVEKNSTATVTNNGNIGGVIYTAGIDASGEGNFNIVNNGNIGKVEGVESQVARGIQVVNESLNKGKISVENNGNIISSSRDLSSPVGIIVSTFNSDVKVMNNGNIEVGKAKEENTYPAGISLGIKAVNSETPNGVYEIINGKTGTIKTEAKGISVSYNGDPNNFNGKLLVQNDGKILTKTTGIEVNGTKSEIINNGEIIVSGTDKGNYEDHGTSKGIKATNTKVGLEVINNGTIKIEKANHGIGIELYNGNLVNTSSGIIDLGDSTNSTGIYLAKGKDVEKSNAIAKNEGLIKLNLDGKNLAVKNVDGGKFTNTGKVQITDKMASELKDFDLSTIFEGEYIHLGMIQDKEGKAILSKDDIIIGGNITTDSINDMASQNKPINAGDGTVITAGKDLTVGALNVVGNVIVKNNGDAGANFKGTTINLDNSGILSIGETASKGDLTLKDGSINGSNTSNPNTKEIKKEDIKFNGTGSSLNLDGTTVNNTIIGANGVVNVTNGTFVDSIVKSEMNIGNNEKVLGKNSVAKVDTKTKFENNINIKNNGQLVLAVDSKNNNALQNSTGITVTGDGVDKNGDIALDLSNMNGDGATISLGNGNTFTNVDVTTTSGDNGVYIVNDDKLGSDKVVTITYNNNLYANNSIINNINNQAKDVNSFFSQDIAEREKQLDTIYGANIYSQTVKATYDNYKLNENTVLNLGRAANVGEWIATGTYLYTDKSFDREGTVGTYNTDVESHGLLANIEYGLNEKTSLGFVFSGTKQDIDTVGGDAEGDLFYLGAYNKTTVGNEIDLTYGVGYQLGKYDSNNNAGKVGTSSSYDTNAYGAFAQVKKNIELGNDLTFIPKFKLGYTYVDQDDVKDSYFGVEDASTSTVDANLGFGLSKVVPMEKGKITFTTGIEYTKVFGDTDKEFRGSFNGKDGGRNYFDVLGAELSEDNVGFTVMGTVEQTNGMFYNLGLSYTFGSNDTEETNIQAGLGYKF